MGIPGMGIQRWNPYLVKRVGGEERYNFGRQNGGEGRGD